MTASDLKTSEDGAGGRIAAFVTAWRTWGEPDVTFDSWVRRVSQTFMDCRIRGEAAARLVGTTIAELEAVLHLATMEDEDLQRIAERVPPKTTWFTLAGVSGEAVTAALDALAELSTGESPSAAVRAAVEEADPSTHSKVASLSGGVFGHMAKKAKQYDLLTARGRSMLASAKTRKNSGNQLTLKQVAYVQDLLNQLVDGGAVKRKSPDGDQVLCDMVLDALDR